MYHVYRFLDNKNNVLYVGYTSNILIRMREQHFGNSGHLDKSLIQNVSKVEHLHFINQDEALFNEKYYINLYKPKYNTTQYIINFNSDFTIQNDWSFYCNISNGKITEKCNIGNTSDKTRCLLYFSEQEKDLKKELEELAKEQNRSFNNLIITILKNSLYSTLK